MTYPRYAAALQLSLLTSLGLLPLACGGSSTTDGDGGSGGSGAGNGSSGSSSKAGSSSRAGSGSGGTGGVACTSPTKDPLTGLVRCQEGYTHRPTAPTCGVDGVGTAKALPAGGASGLPLPEPEPLPRADGTVTCADDRTKCSQYAYGYCDDYYAGGLGPEATCRSGCFTDQDCGSGNVCVCGDDRSPTNGVCRAATCQTDADCASGYRCADYAVLCGPGGFACQTPDDECTTNADCVAQGVCGFDRVSGFRRCSGNAVCGRPFLVEHEARTAPALARADWSDDVAPSVAHLSGPERSALAAHWTRLGQLEHASIAAFARFSLQLLSLGAPPALVEQCTAALADETAHAKLCFGIASAYAGCSVGPGPLDIGGSLAHASLTDVVDLVIAEGCFGETSAALDALCSADAASDPVIRRAYARIAADEQRHAELAFRFVRWALTQSPAAVAGRLAAALAAPPSRDDAAIAVTLPCLEALLSLAAPTAAAPHASTAQPLM